MSDTEKKVPLRVMTPPAILSYPHLFEPVAGPDGGEPKYSATFIFPKGTDLAVLKAAAMAAGRAKWGAKFEEGLRNGSRKFPFRTDVEEKGYPEGSTFFTARSKQAPGLASRYKGPNGKATPITKEQQVPGNAGELYAGCMVRASLVAFAYDNVSKGVTFALNNIQKLDEGKRLDNRRAAEDEFTDNLSDEPASLDDVL